MNARNSLPLVSKKLIFRCGGFGLFTTQDEPEAN